MPARLTPFTSQTLSPALERLRGRLVVSVQADEGSPLRDPAHIAALSRAALLGGAAGLRLRSGEDIRAVRGLTDVPVIGLTKQNHPATPVYISDARRGQRGGRGRRRSRGL